MSEHMREAPVTAPVDRPSERGEAFAEVMLLMPCRQLEALEKGACSQGMTIAHLLRRLLRYWLAEWEGARALEEPAFVDAEAEEGVDHGLIQVLRSQRIVGPN